MRLLRDAALNTTGQTTRGVPDLGVGDGTDTTTANPDHGYDIKRGDQVRGSILNLAGQADGPDVELEPQDRARGTIVLSTLSISRALTSQRR